MYSLLETCRRDRRDVELLLSLVLLVQRTIFSVSYHIAYVSCCAAKPEAQLKLGSRSKQLRVIDQSWVAVAGWPQ